ncbi:MAG: hypothetical protein K2X38_24980 [Gemmataceae bacterium]|nr:hypothetical protein [Gemmataceae bacterium]
MAMLVECPSCRRKQMVGHELAGRYTLCVQCRCRFYVEAPPLGAAVAIVPKETVQADTSFQSPARTTIDDLLVDTQKGEAIVLRMLRRQNRLLLGMLLAIAMILAVNVAMLWLVLRGR